MEELIPVLIAIVWFIYKMYQGAQKKADRKQHRAKPIESAPVKKEPEFDIDDMVKSIFGLENVAPKPNPVYQSPIESIESDYRQVEHFDSSTNDYLETEMDSYQEKPVSVEYQHESIQEKVSRQAANNVEEEIEYNNILEDFDVRKAIIYSAILERRYI